jgi:HemY protein
VTALVIVIIMAIAVWSLLRGVWRTPERIRRARRERRHAKGRHAITQGLIAIGTGDHFGARYHANAAKRLANQDPLALLLHAQSAQLDGDRDAARRAFEVLASREDTRLLGLRGLFIEAQRNDDPYTAVAMAEEALKFAPASTWASHAVLGFRCAKHDWAGALAILDTNHAAGLIDAAPYRRQRGVLLTARALDLETSDRDLSRQNIMEAVKLAPTLVPAAVLAAKFHSEDNQVRKSMRVTEAAWAAQPHPDLADAYAHVRLGDTARERLKRIETLAAKSPAHIESALAMGRAAIDAGEFSRARDALAPFAAAPTQRVAMLMAELERAEHGDGGEAREWTLRAVRAAYDPVWTADGYVSDRWRPVSPVTGRIDAFQWLTPVAALPSDKKIVLQDVTDHEPLPGPRAQPALIEIVSEMDDKAAGPLLKEPETSMARKDAVAELAAASIAAPSTIAPPVFRPRREIEPRASLGPPPVIPLVRAPDDPGISDGQNEDGGLGSPDEGQTGGWRGFLSRLVG